MSGAPGETLQPRRKRTIVLQSFWGHAIPDWLARCLKSVADWATLRGHDYLFEGDEMCALCGPAYIERVGGNICAIVNLGRLEWTKAKLSEGYDEVIWLDADVFVFDPAHFEMATRGGYAFSREVWVERGPKGLPRLGHVGLHNAAFLFTPRQRDLPLFIGVIRHTVMTRKITSNYQIGVRLISGLAVPLAIPVMTNVGMFSADVVCALAADTADFLVAFARLHRYPTRAANLCWSKRDDFSETSMMRAMDRLETTQGEVLNGHLVRVAAP